MNNLQNYFTPGKTLFCLLFLVIFYLLVKKYDYETLLTFGPDDSLKNASEGYVNSIGIGTDCNYTDLKWCIEGTVESGKIACTFTRGLGDSIEKDTIIGRREYTIGNIPLEEINVGESGLSENSMWIEVLEPCNADIHMTLRGRRRGYQILLDLLGLNLISRF